MANYPQNMPAFNRLKDRIATSMAQQPTTAQPLSGMDGGSRLRTALGGWQSPGQTTGSNYSGTTPGSRLFTALGANTGNRGQQGQGYDIGGNGLGSNPRGQAGTVNRPYDVGGNSVSNSMHGQGGTILPYDFGGNGLPSNLHGQTPGTTGQTGQSGSTDSSSIADMIKQQYAQADEAAKANIWNGINSSISDQQKIINTADQKYQPTINDSETQRAQTLRSLLEASANRGDASGGIGRMEQLTADTAGANRLNDISLQKQNLINDATSQINQLKQQGRNQEAAAVASNAAARLQALITQTNTDREFGFNKDVTEAGLTGMYNGEQTLAGKQFNNDVQQQQFQNSVTEAGLTGTYNGEQTLAGKQFASDATQQQVDNAMNRVSMMGYVDDAASKILGLPVGTPSWQANQWKQEFDYQKAQDSKKSSGGGSSSKKKTTKYTAKEPVQPNYKDFTADAERYYASSIYPQDVKQQMIASYAQQKYNAAYSSWQSAHDAWAKGKSNADYANTYGV